MKSNNTWLFAIGVMGLLALVINFKWVSIIGNCDKTNLQQVDLDSHADAASANNNKSSAPLLTSNKLAQVLAKTPVGNLGPANTSRQKYRYYDSLFYATLQFGADATSLIEVGCASDPFIKYFDWIDKRTCVAPYYINYNGGGRHNKLGGSHHEHAIESVVSDFMEYDIEDYSYDLLICSQVVEHVPDPSAFIKKLIRTAKTSIISVPYDWPDCGEKCGHLSHGITYGKLLEWTTPQKPIYSSIINDHRGSTGRRILLVFQQGE